MRWPGFEINCRHTSFHARCYHLKQRLTDQRDFPAISTAAHNGVCNLPHLVLSLASFYSLKKEGFLFCMTCGASHILQLCASLFWSASSRLSMLAYNKSHNRFSLPCADELWVGKGNEELGSAPSIPLRMAMHRLDGTRTCSMMDGARFKSEDLTTRRYQRETVYERKSIFIPRRLFQCTIVDRLYFLHRWTIRDLWIAQPITEYFYPKKKKKHMVQSEI